jgi:hypothetical protein
VSLRGRKARFEVNIWKYWKYSKFDMYYGTY